jgi:hypothetical protein
VDSSTLVFLSQQVWHLSWFVGPLVLVFFVLCAGIVWLSERSRWKGSRWLRCLSGWLLMPDPPNFQVGLTVYLLSVLAALAFGFIGGEVLRYKTSRSYRLEILANYDPLHALVRRISKSGEVLDEQPWVFRTCPHETQPDFDTGMIVNVVYEVSSDSNGECNTFTGPKGSYIAERDPLNPKKFADFRAPEWQGNH